MGKKLEFFNSDFRIIFEHARQYPTGKMAANSNDRMKEGDGFHIFLPVINDITIGSAFVIQK